MPVYVPDVRELFMGFIRTYGSYQARCMSKRVRFCASAKDMPRRLQHLDGDAGDGDGAGDDRRARAGARAAVLIFVAHRRVSRRLGTLFQKDHRRASRIAHRAQNVPRGCA
jgi:hypothetical protein